MVDFLLGLLGCVGFEALRFYKKILADEDPIPSNRLLYYSLTLLCLGLFSGSLAALMELPNKVYCLYVGFSVPSSVKAVKGIRFPARPRAKSIEVDDVAAVDGFAPRSAGAPKSPTMKPLRYAVWLDSFFD